MHIYTKTGDQGKTGLIGGQRIFKNDPYIETLGTIDEAIAHIGLLSTITKQKRLKKLLQKIQSDLFTIGAEISDPEKKVALQAINEHAVRFLESHIDTLEEKLPTIKQFALPGGTILNAHLHIARAVCRKAERLVVDLNKKTPLSSHILTYLNRLGDLLFMLARDELYTAKKSEILWRYPRRVR